MTRVSPSPPRLQVALGVVSQVSAQTFSSWHPRGLGGEASVTLGSSKFLGQFYLEVTGMSLLGLRPLGEPDGLWFSLLPVRQGLPYVTPSSLQGG